MKACPICGIAIVKAHGNRVYCSRKCTRKAAYRMFKEHHGIYVGHTRYHYRVDNKLCLLCGKPLTVKYLRCDECRSKNRIWQTDAARRLKAEIIEAYGGKCVCCGETTFEFLSIDHINGKGNEHRRQLKSEGIGLYNWLKKHTFPKDNYQLLCYNCNMAKSLYGICPHQTKKVNLKKEV